MVQRSEEYNICGMEDRRPGLRSVKSQNKSSQEKQKADPLLSHTRFNNHRLISPQPVPWKVRACCKRGTVMTTHSTFELFKFDFIFKYEVVCVTHNMRCFRDSDPSFLIG